MSARLNAAVGGFIWLPIVAVMGLIGWALSWWIAVAATAYLVIIFVPTRLYGRRLRRRFASDPAGARAYADRVRNRTLRWVKWGGLLFVAMLLGLLALTIVLAATGNNG